MVITPSAATLDAGWGAVTGAGASTGIDFAFVAQPCTSREERNNIAPNEKT
jgi:hypothetical protein